jgi:phosphoglycerate kinase
MLKLSDLSLANKRAVIRVDFNVPIQAGRVVDDTRIRAAIPTLNHVLAHGGSVILLSHWGRPTEGQYDPAYTLAPVADVLASLLNRPVRFEPHWQQGVTISAGEVVLCENVRFCVGEEANSPALAKQMAALGDLFVMDAFASAHRAHASTTGIIAFAPYACAGLLLMQEIHALNQAISQAQHPIVAIVGGAKVSTKLTVLETLLSKVDTLIVGGGIANTFLAAQGKAIGASLFEADLVPQAQHLLVLAAQQQVQIVVPLDVVTATHFDKNASASLKQFHEINADDKILDVGPRTCAQFSALLQDAATIIWNGPVGVFEFPAFAAGTRALAQAIATSHAFSLAGGGDTLAAIAAFGISDAISYISTGGGAFLEFLEGKTLPALSALDQAAKMK